MSVIPCQKCRNELPREWLWYVCDTCGYRICHFCYAGQGGKCSDCAFGWMKEKE
ncbi:hypothetical protein [Bacillus coreaensis]|jgi:hypothetical protein